MIPSTIGYGSTEDLRRDCMTLLKAAYEERVSPLTYLLTSEYVETICEGVEEDMSAHSYRMDDFVETLWDEIARLEVSDPQRAFVSSIVKNAYNQAIADLDWAYEHFSKSITECFEAGDFYLDVDLNRDTTPRRMR